MVGLVMARPGPGGKRPATGGGTAARFVAGLLLGACQSATQVELAAYGALVADRDIDPQAGMAGCAALLRPDLRGDCAQHVVSIEAARPTGKPEELCPQVDPGPAQDECWFLAAEAHGRRGREASAAQLCKQAGAYKEDCAQHLWQGEVYALVHGAGPRAMVAELPRAERLYARWERYLGADTAIATRFWARYFQNGFEGLGSIELGLCAAVPDPNRAAACVTAGAELFAQRLAPALDAAKVDLCDNSRSDEEIAAFVRSVPDARLTALVAARRAQRCPTSHGLPPSGPPGAATSP